MDLSFLKNLKIELEPVIEKAGEIIMEVYESDHAINEKSDGSPVTEADTKSEKIIVDDKITEKVLETVVEHTGYPADFIEFDQDLEGELGVDSVKQAEIMADLREFFGLPLDENFVLSEYPTLNHMISYLTQMSGGEKPLSSSQVEDISDIQTNSIISDDISTQTQESDEKVISSEVINVDEKIKSAVLEVVVEHTGYPEDFIGFDQDLEGELGVDSVKQAEMMGDLRTKFELPVDDSFVLSEHPTLNHIASYISKMSNTVPKKEEVIEEIKESELQKTETIQQKTIVNVEKTDDSGVRRWQVEV